jgi:hypothetical protein
MKKAPEIAVLDDLLDDTPDQAGDTAGAEAAKAGQAAKTDQAAKAGQAGADEFELELADIKFDYYGDRESDEYWAWTLDHFDPEEARAGLGLYRGYLWNDTVVVKSDDPDLAELGRLAHDELLRKNNTWEEVRDFKITHVNGKQLPTPWRWK